MFFKVVDNRHAHWWYLSNDEFSLAEILLFPCSDFFLVGYKMDSIFDTCLSPVDLLLNQHELLKNHKILN